MDNMIRKTSRIKNKFFKSPLENILHEATSNENWNVSTLVMDQIAEHSNQYKDYLVIMKHLWKRLDQNKKKWRKIEKSLSIFEHLILLGNRNCRLEIEKKVVNI